MRTAKVTVRPVVATGSAFPGRFAAALIVVAVFVAYVNSFNAPFIFDDGPTIELNQTIRQLWRFDQVLHPPTDEGSGVAGRPVVNLTLAVNYAISGVQPWSYHVANTLIHVLAALTLFGLARRALESPALRDSCGRQAVPAAFGLALLWAVHPLQTESVTCAIQRTESLVGLFYLLTLYCFVRSSDATGPRPRLGWAALSVAACALGMGTKEVMVTAPVIAVLYDRTFVSGTFRGVWRQRWRHYGLITTWALLFYLMQGNPGRGGTAGYTTVTWWQYLVTQCEAIVIYLKLTFWLHPLVLDYGTYLAPGLLAVLPQAVFLVALAAGTVWALWQRPVLGFLGAWFFIILSPSSSVVPLVTQTIAEHRMYLPLAAVIALGIGLLACRAPRLVLPVSVGLAFVLGIVTINRNRLYQSPEAIYRDNLAHWPENDRVHIGLAGIADKAGDYAEAVFHYENGLRLKPHNSGIRFDLARDLVKVGRRAEAVPHFEEVLRIRPRNVSARTNYAACLLELGRFDDAVREFEIVTRQNRHDADSQFNLAEALAKAGRTAEALPHYQEAVTLKPAGALMQYRYGDTLLKAERIAEAAAAYQAAVTLQPDLFAAWTNLGGSLMILERVDEAVRAYEGALRAKPGDPAALKNFEFARSQLRR